MIEFKKTKSKFVCEVFGISEKEFDVLGKSMLDFFNRLNGADNEDYKKTEMLQEYLESDEFKKTDYKLDGDNQIFLLGYVFGAILSKMAGEGDSFLQFLEHMANRGMIEKGDPLTAKKKVRAD